MMYTCTVVERGIMMKDTKKEREMERMWYSNKMSTPARSNDTKLKTIPNVKCYITSNASKRQTLQNVKTLTNIKCFQTSNATKRQTLQNVKHYQMSNTTKHQLLQNSKRCKTLNDAKCQTIPTVKRYQTSNAFKHQMLPTAHSLNIDVWCQQPNWWGQ